jgi:pyroglutamyl-peptidase
MHLPLLPEQAARHPGQASLPSLAFATMVDGVRIALAAALARSGDLRAGGGSLG